MLVKVVVVFVFGKARRNVIVVDGRSGALRFVSVGHGLRHGGTRRRLKPAASGREGTRSVTRSVVGSCVALRCVGGWWSAVPPGGRGGDDYLRVSC